MTCLPSIIIPSQGILSPGLTRTRVPTATDVAGRTTTSFVTGLIRLALSGRKLMIAASALRALDVHLDSSASLIANRNDTAKSKTTWIWGEDDLHICPI